MDWVLPGFWPLLTKWGRREELLSMQKISSSALERIFWSNSEKHVLNLDMSTDVYETVLLASTDVFYLFGSANTRKMSRKIKGMILENFTSVWRVILRNNPQYFPAAESLLWPCWYCTVPHKISQLCLLLWAKSSITSKDQCCAQAYKFPFPTLVFSKGGNRITADIDRLRRDLSIYLTYVDISLVAFK